MAADSPAEKRLKKILLHNKLLTERQWFRVADSAVGKSELTMPDELVERLLVDPKAMKKAVEAVTSKGLVFPPLNEDLQAGEQASQDD